jgi:hypothetical protein
MVPLTKTLATKLSDKELEVLERNFRGFEDVARIVENTVPKIESTYESALNFHETLETLVSDETFDIGLYNPILRANTKHLEGVKERIELFRSEFEKASKRLAADAAALQEERSRRLANALSTKKGWLERFVERERLRWWAGSHSGPSSTFDSEARLVYTTARLVYGVATGSDIIL